LTAHFVAFASAAIGIPIRMTQTTLRQLSASCYNFPDMLITAAHDPRTFSTLMYRFCCTLGLYLLNSHFPFPENGLL